MRVDLIDYTGCGSTNKWYAADLLIWTKRTRVEMTPGGLMEIKQWSEVKKLEELAYIAATIPSSWEMVDFTFLIQGVTRAITHQIVRTRTGSYAQQNMSVQKMKGWEYHVGPSIEASLAAKTAYVGTMAQIAKAYEVLCNLPGVLVEDARGVLPTNITTNIVCKYNLRTLCDMLRKRLSPRNQGAKPGVKAGEWTELHGKMKERMIEVMPWTDLFLNRSADKVAAEAYDLANKVRDGGLRVDIMKRVDQLLVEQEDK